MSPFDPVGRYPRVVLEAKDPNDLAMFVWIANRYPGVQIRVMPACMTKLEPSLKKA